MSLGINTSGLLFIWTTVWITPPTCIAAGDERCRDTRIDIASNRINDSCQFFESVDDAPVACEISLAGNADEQLKIAECAAKQCCWLEGNTLDADHAWKTGCYKKPVRCYIDLRPELCPELRGVEFNHIYEGYSINRTHCFVENVQPYFVNKYDLFGDAVSPRGVRILGDDEREKSCCRWKQVNVTELDAVTCKVTLAGFNPGIGVIWAKKCVVKVQNYYIPYDLNSTTACTCHLNAWLEHPEETLSVSTDIRDFVEEEEKQNRCTQILGRLVRSSWRRHLDIVNSAEANVIMNALLNITDGKAVHISEYDANVLLDTSDQLTKYKFYEGIENDSAKYLIKSSAKVMSNLMKRISKTDKKKLHKEEAEEKLLARSLIMPAELKDAPDGGDDAPELPEELQWKIMSQLEGITENAASQIKIPMDMEKYVVGAAEAAVKLQVAIARSSDVSLLTNLSNSNHGHFQAQDVHVTDFSSYEHGPKEANVAAITVFYSAATSNNSSTRRASDILAINLRALSQGYVQRSLSLPVQFTMLRNAPCGENAAVDGECNDKPECAFAEEGSDGRNWSSVGCTVEYSEGNTTTCRCNHTTHFAVLMQIDDTISKQDTRALELLSISLGSISVASLAATVAIFVLYRKLLLKDRMLIHMHLIVALMCGYVFFLCGSAFSKHHLSMPTGCFISAAASHFFFLSTFFWFLVEGIYLFQKVVLVFSTKWAERVPKYSPLLGWLCPAVVVAASIGASRMLPTLEEEEDNYYDLGTCFLQHRNHMIWAFMAPVLLIIMINCFVLTRVLLVIYRSSLSSAKKSKTTEQEQHSISLRNSAKGAVILLPILGIPWVVNVFVNIHTPLESGYNFVATLGAYIHVILMGLQGVTVFVFYCIFNTEVRNAYRLSAARRKSMASIEPVSKRKRSRAPLLASKNSSPESGRYGTSSMNANHTHKTTELSSPDSSAPPSPGKSSVLPGDVTIC